jgi:beta-lactamase superfamily II metal-dependent hydrolase
VDPARGTRAALEAEEMINDCTGFEIDVTPVGTASKSGDAIAIRLATSQKHAIVVVDGGNIESGEALVDHVRTQFSTTNFIDHVVCTHPDDDHTSGLRRVLESFVVGTLWIHQPWNHAADLVSAFKYGWTEKGLAQHLRECFPIVNELCQLAVAKGVALREPFQGDVIGGFNVLAPTHERYLRLVPEMNRTPAQKSIAEAVMDAVIAVAKSAFSVLESWNLETLREPDPGANSASNESSVILFGNFSDRRVLLTGDAGVAGLKEAYEYAMLMGIPIVSPDFVQIPHHGGRRNVSPTILDTILGARVPADGTTRGWAVASAAKKDEHHPRRVVLNAFKRRGYMCTSTEGQTVHYRHNFPRRPGFGPLDPFGLFPQVEE